MGMDTAFRDLPKQFAFEPEIINENKLKKAQKFFFCGMGGSAMAGDLLTGWDPGLPIFTHRDYGIPAYISEKDKKKSLFIMSSYSGNTEEITGRTDGLTGSFQEAHDQGLAMAAIAVGGRLIELAKEYKIPYIQIPDTGIQPRAATGFSIRSLIALMKLKDAAEETAALADSLKPDALQQQGKDLAQRLKDHVPVIYSSQRYWRVAEIGKIKFNETGKIPAFWNRFPELNHNEMTSFDVQESTKHLYDRFAFIILRSPDDHPQILKRMEVTATLLKKRGLPVEFIDFPAGSVMHQMFSVLLILDWAAFYTAENYGLESEQVPMVEEMKKLI